MKTLNLSLFIILIFLSAHSERNESGKPAIPLSNEDLHLYLLMGQSNMAGRGEIEAIETLADPRVFMLDKEMKWVPAKDPMHFDKPAAGVGLGLTFGKIMANDDPTIRIGLIPTAVGGSSINAWFKDSLHHQTNTYPYNDMIRRAKAAMKEGTLKGILWHQGESDSNTKEGIADYPEKFHAMVDSLKADLGITSIPIVIGEIGHFIYSKSPLAENLNEMLAQISSQDDCLGLVRSFGLQHKGDSTHFNTDSYHELGKRYAAKMKEIQLSCPAIAK